MYRIHVKGHRLGSRDRFSKVTDERNFTVELLKPYRNYTIRVQAMTLAGWGQFTEWETQQTNQGCKYAIC